MEVHSFSLGQLQANCYFLVIDDQCIIVDPADDAPFLLEELSRRNLTLLALIATHGHFDHVMAAGEMQTAFNKTTESQKTAEVDGIPLPFYIHKEDAFLVERLGETAKYFLGYDPGVLPPLSSVDLKKGGGKKIGPFSFSVIETPGHTPGSCCLYFKEEGLLFSGDTLFRSGIGRYDFSYSDKSELQKSVEHLLKLPAETVVYPGHGPQTSIIGEENIVSMFL